MLCITYQDRSKRYANDQFHKCRAKKPKPMDTGSHHVRPLDPYDESILLPKRTSHRLCLAFANQCPATVKTIQREYIKRQFICDEKKKKNKSIFISIYR